MEFETWPIAGSKWRYACPSLGRFGTATQETGPRNLPSQALYEEMKQILPQDPQGRLRAANVGVDTGWVLCGFKRSRWTFSV
jgi:hypothetical protein